MYFQTGIEEIDAIRIRPLDGRPRAVTKSVRIGDGGSGYVFSLGADGAIYSTLGVDRHAYLNMLPDRPWVLPIVQAARRFGIVSKSSYDAFVRLYEEERTKANRESDLRELQRIAKRAGISDKAIAPLSQRIRKSNGYRRSP